MIISSSKSFFSAILLFLCLFISSRFIQKILFEESISNNFISRKILNRNECKPKEDSLINHYESLDKSVLIVMLDGFPNKKLFSSLTAKESNLHKFLQEESNEYLDLKTIIPFTYKSLPHILGRIDPSEKCYFPYLSGYFRPNLNLASTWMSSNQSVCQKYIRPENFSKRIFQKINGIFNPNEKISWNYHGTKMPEQCYLRIESTTMEIIDNIQRNQNNPRKISIIAESEFHDDIDPNLSMKKADINLFYTYDEDYLKAIKKLLEHFSKNNLLDEIIIMNDHGPRTQIFGEITDKNISQIKNKLIKDGDLDNDYYGVFISRFYLNKNNSSDKSLEFLIPKSKEERYINNGAGFPVFVKKF